MTSVSSYLLTKKRETGCAVAKKRFKAPINQFAMQRPFIEKRRGEKAREIKEAVDTPTWIAEREKKERLNGSHYDSSGISEKRPIRNRCDCD